MFDVRWSMFDGRCSMVDVRCSMFDVPLGFKVSSGFGIWGFGGFGHTALAPRRNGPTVLLCAWGNSAASSHVLFRAAYVAIARIAKGHGLATKETMKVVMVLLPRDTETNFTSDNVMPPFRVFLFGRTSQIVAACTLTGFALLLVAITWVSAVAFAARQAFRTARSKRTPARAGSGRGRDRRRSQHFSHGTVTGASPQWFAADQTRRYSSRASERFIRRPQNSRRFK
jgi:hypothetical protein